jgi:hypothetical protein
MGHTGRRRAQAGLLAVTMLLLAIGLFSAGAARPGHAAVVAGAFTAVETAVATPLSAHEHHHGNDWAPTLSKRLRPVATVPVLGVASARPTTSGVHGGEPPTAAPLPTGDGLALLGVLRV